MSEPDDQAWILQRERGEDVSHIPADTRAGYDRLAALIETLLDETPDPGWKQRVLATLDEPPARKLSTPSRHRSRHRAWLVAGCLAATTAVAAILAMCSRVIEAQPPAVATDRPRRPPSIRPAQPGSTSDAPLITAEIRRSDAPHRGGGSASIGDTLVLHVQVDRPSELRVYGDAGEPLARCTETRGCAVERIGELRRFQLELVLRASGTVRAVLFTGDPIPDSSQNLDADVETAQRADVEARQVSFVHVQ
jgi:hypothetical protein